MGFNGREPEVWKETYALVVVISCWARTEVKRERIKVRALKDFIGSRRRC
jgi:hypothetical protein